MTDATSICGISFRRDFRGNMTAITDDKTENQLLINFLEGYTNADDNFFELMNPRILRFARRNTRDLPIDIQEEVAQQTFANLLITPVSNFNPERGTAWQFLIGQILNAEKQVRSGYGLPQRRKIKVPEGSDKPTVPKQFTKVVSIDAEETINPQSKSFERNLEGEFLVRTVFRKSQKPLVSALKLIYFQNKTKEQAAKIVGLSRFQMHRQITNLRSQLMAA